MHLPESMLLKIIITSHVICIPFQSFVGVAKGRLPARAQQNISLLAAEEQLVVAFRPEVGKE